MIISKTQKLKHMFAVSHFENMNFNNSQTKPPNSYDTLYDMILYGQ